MLDKIIKKSLYKNIRIKIVVMPKIIIIIANKLNNNQEIYKGIRCISMACERSLPEIKSISFLSSFLAHKKAEEKGCFDAILVDDKKYIYEGAYSNIFWFTKDTLYTRKDKVLPSITRKVILEISPFKVKLKIIDIKELCNADEVFITSSIKGNCTNY